MNFSTLFAGNIVYRGLNILAGFGIMLLLTRLMGTDGFGLISLMVANVTLFNLLSCLGAESSVIFHGASRKMTAGKILTLIYAVFFFQLIMLVGVELIGHALTGHYWLVKGPDLVNLFMGIVFLLGITLADKYTALLYGRHLYTMANRIIFFSNLITFSIFLFYYFGRLERDPLFFLQLYIATIIGQAILLLISYHLFTKEKTGFEKIDRPDIKTFFSYSFIVFITNLIQFLAYRVDYWLLDHYKGESSLGIYALAIRLNQFIWVIPILVSSLIFPLAADKEKNFDENKLLSLLRVTSTFLLIVSVVIFFIAPFLIPV
ncbi:MAG TPA: oligosaccharide flippase family protein, partial [Chitinophagaceae bacterium]|nr:oligosaccharide flippase family protein [Chitinophagaceae bacterium]